MRRHKSSFILASFSVLAACASSPTSTSTEAGAADAIAADGFAVTAPEMLFPGAQYFRLERGGDALLVAHVIEIDLNKADARFLITPADASGGMEHVAKRTTAFLAETGAQIAVNASYFLPFAGGSPGGDDYYPHEGDPASVSGAALSGGETVSPVETDLDIRVNAIVCFRGEHVVIMDGQICPKDSLEGVAAGPRLLAAGAQRSFMEFDNRYASTPQPRSSIGVSADGGTVFLVVVDGRQKDYSLGATLDDLSAIFRDLGAADALNLDGGGSSTLAVEHNGAPALLNRPIHTGVPGRERPVANHLAVFLGGDAQ